MAKFSDIAKGALARKPVELPLLSGRVVTVAVVIMLGDTEAKVLRDAREFAKEHGLVDPKDGDPLYALGVQVHTIARACLDPDSPEAAPQPFFDGGVKQILDPDHGLDRHRIALLFEQQQAWQHDLAPGPKNLTAVEYFQALLEIKEAPPEAELPFVRWPREAQAGLVRFMASLLFSSPPSKSDGGASSPTDSESQNGAPSSRASAKPSTTPLPEVGRGASPSSEGDPEGGT